MDFGQFLYMRHEIILSALALIVLIMEISSDNKSKANIIPVLVALFFINTVAGFLPVETGSLFGGMYKTTALIILLSIVHYLHVRMDRYLKNCLHNVSITAITIQ